MAELFNTLIQPRVKEKGAGFVVLEEEVETLNSRLEEISPLLYQKIVDIFRDYDEVWVVGHRGNVADSYIGQFFLREKLELIHATATLGGEARVMINSGEHQSTYDSYVTQANPNLRHFVKQAIVKGKKVFVLMPFPNKALEEMIESAQSKEYANIKNPGKVICVAPTNLKTFEALENKAVFASIVEKAIGSVFPENVIPNKTVVIANTSYQDARSSLGLKGGENFYAQLLVSAGGGGTRKITSEGDYSRLQTDWQGISSESREIKISKEIIDSYPANGTACIIPSETEPDGCIVLLDPLSKKPVDPKSNAGIGNDWGHTFPPDVLEQYTKIVTALGKYLYKEHEVIGLFGPDCLVSHDKLYVNEVNPRHQGTTPFQTLNALLNGRVPIEYIDLLLKVDPESTQLIVDAIGGSAEGYNTRALRETGCYYLKLMNKSDKKLEVINEFNGPFKLIRKAGNVIDFVPVKKYKSKTELVLAKDPDVVWIDGPKKGEEIAASLTPFGFIVGYGMQVFDKTVPRMTPEAEAIKAALLKKILEF